jgi:hypothetical protein
MRAGSLLNSRFLACLRAEFANMARTTAHFAIFGFQSRANLGLLLK